ncbi:uncharacterized protein [Watersipora subatra]|uniref:uncharacterized protein n=1 Tax=Watersipora subatra TaxID=2589382 RepID=UPI00355B2C3A
MAKTSVSSMQRAMDTGWKLRLKDAELAKFIEENEPKFAAEIEREERREERQMEREAKTEAEAEDRQLQMQMKQMEIDSQKQARELEMQKEIEEKRLAHELEMKKLEVESVRMDDSKNESTGLEWISNKLKPKLPVFDEKTDDMDSYLQRFE